ncbi:MAG: hypothetical protein ABIH59_01105 [archaeon]
MTVRKTLTSIVLAGALALGGAGCGRNPEYDFKGKIGNEYVESFETLPNGFTYLSNLKVKKEDGSKILYFSGDDFKLDYVEVTVGENTTRYEANSKNPIYKEIIQKAQKEFDDYLSKITEIQTAPLSKE